MKHKLITLYILIIICSCAKDDTSVFCTADINTGNGSNECVSTEEITSTITNFTILDKGLQEEGTAKGVKINEEWEASALLNHYDSSFSILAITYWTDSIQSYRITGEFMSMSSIPINNTLGCYYLTSNESTTDSIRCTYSIKEDDVTLLRYELDESKENKLEILEYDNATGILKAKLKASFIINEAAAPDFPEKVRFFNVDIETY